MNAMEVAQSYFDAWNARDAAAINGALSLDGVYRDPIVAHGVRGEALTAYANELWDAFPDLSFEIVSAAPTGDRSVAAQWLMWGTNLGSYKGLPPTGRKVTMSGADFIDIEGDKIRSVTGYFDSRAVPDQLGLQVVVQPHSTGPFSFGTSTVVQTGKRSKPGAFSITAIEARTEEEVGKIRELSRAISMEMKNIPGFIGATMITAGKRMMTVSAWESAENPRALQTAGAHPEAMRKFFSPELSAGGYTSVWIPARINTMWVRCPACSRMADSEKSQTKCSCAATLPEPMPYW